MPDPLDQILKLGDPKLYEPSAPLLREQLPEAMEKARTMAGLIEAFRGRYGAGRAIAAPQIGYMKRLIVLNMDHPILIINPSLEEKSREMMELWDDCMSFPNLLVRVKRHRRCRLRFLNKQWQEESWELEDDFSELLQHEYDHLEGILATQRAIDNQSFALSQKQP